VRQFISITTIAILLTATACAPKRTEVSCAWPDGPEQPSEGSQYYFVSTAEGSTGIHFSKITPDSFWACAGIEEGDTITEINSLPLPKFPKHIEALKQIDPDERPLELSVLDASEDLRTIVVR
jgi:S1-C subfamily serine protease